MLTLSLYAGMVEKHSEADAIFFAGTLRTALIIIIGSMQQQKQQQKTANTAPIPIPKMVFTWAV